MNPVNWLLNPLGFILTRKRNVDPGIRLSIARSHVLEVTKSACVLDIGANRGQWALELLDSGYKGRLISFEPIGNAFKHLSEVSSQYSNWDVFNFAIGPEVTEAIINVSANDQLSSSLLPMGLEHSIAAPHANFISHESVSVRLIDPFLINEEFVYLKIDTQGYELRILESISASSWKTIKALEIEVSLVDAYLDSGYIEDVMDFLRKKGLRPYRIENGLARSGAGQQIQVDIIFVSESQGTDFN